MAGITPKTRLLVTFYDSVKFDCGSYLSVAICLGFHVEEVRGSYHVCDCDGMLMNPSYNNDFKDKSEVLSDWAKNYLKKNLGSHYKIYRYLTQE